jgi:hypothetical protein
MHKGQEDFIVAVQVGVVKEAKIVKANNNNNIFFKITMEATGGGKHHQQAWAHYGQAILDAVGATGGWQS